MTTSKVEESFNKLEKPLDSLENALKQPIQPDRIAIDATIQRFKYTIELYWKLLKRILESKGKEVRYPKDVLREAFAGHLIEDESAWLHMLEDRNMTSHVYDEKIADKIYDHIKQYFPILQTTFASLKREHNLLSRNQ